MGTDDHLIDAVDKQRAFVTTRWSMVMAAGSESSTSNRDALESLCETYWYPLYAYARRRTHDREAARDSTQAFFVELLDKKVVAKAMPERGRFRSFLLTSFKNFLSKEWQKKKARKRGGGRSPLALNFETADSRYSIEPAADTLTPEQFFCQQWAIELLNRVLQELEQEFRESGKAEHFAALRGYVIGDHGSTSYQQVADELGMTVDAAKKAASRMRGRYRELLRAEIAETVSSPDQIDDEIRDLFAILSI